MFHFSTKAICFANICPKNVHKCDFESPSRRLAVTASLEPGLASSPAEEGSPQGKNVHKCDFESPSRRLAVTASLEPGLASSPAEEGSPQGKNVHKYDFETPSPRLARVSLFHLWCTVASSSARRSRCILSESSQPHLRRADAPSPARRSRRTLGELPLRYPLPSPASFASAHFVVPPFSLCTIFGLPLVAICSPVPYGA